MSADFLAGQEAFAAPSRRMARERGRAGKRPLRRRSTVVNTGSQICKTAPPPWKPRLSAFHAPFREASLSEPGKAGLSWGPAAPCRANRRRPPLRKRKSLPLTEQAPVAGLPALVPSKGRPAADSQKSAALRLRRSSGETRFCGLSPFSAPDGPPAWG